MSSQRLTVLLRSVIVRARRAVPLRNVNAPTGNYHYMSNNCYMNRARAILKNLFLVIIFIHLFGACSGLPKTYLEQQRLTPDDRIIFNKTVFDSAWKKVNRLYYDQTFKGKDWVKLGDKYRNEAISAADADRLYEVINKMLSELDVSHLVAVRTARKDITDSSKKEGAIGIVIDVLQDKIYIKAVIPDSPAAKAGVMKGWMVSGRNGIEFPDLKNSDLHTIAGEAVTFDFIDQNNQPRSLRIIPVKRDKIRFVEAHELDNGLLYLRMLSFDRRSVKFLRKELKEYTNARGLILDLRSNPGGRLFSCKVAVGQFFPDNIEMGTFIYRGGREKEDDSVDFLTLSYDKPMVILVNSKSGSAAEIFSHILQFHHRATIIGQKTACAVLAAWKLRLPDGGEIMIPISDYIGLNGKRLEGAGVIPDKVVPVATPYDLREGKDREMEAALEILNEKLESGA